jgi:hypothetical protein
MHGTKLCFLIAEHAGASQVDRINPLRRIGYLNHDYSM